MEKEGITRSFGEKDGIVEKGNFVYASMKISNINYGRGKLFMCTSFVSFYGDPIYGMNFDFPVFGK
ncbi:hypothetical protein [Phosphitispora sp. TUW77]|uniref:hypothetical protein n=1 Tax=Phosphitispora sp. TUW77 TaxID=3152361 RepID=UPI003AB34751